MTESQIIKRVKTIMKNLPDCPENPIDINANIVKPFIATENIDLIIVGLDPTVRKKDRTKNPKIAFNLDYNADKDDALKKYAYQLCVGLGVSLENVYVTNLFKYSYTTPPTKTIDVLYKHLEPNLQLLKEELSAYPDCPVIIVGEPLLKLLTHCWSNVRAYWSYRVTTIDERCFFFIKESQNKLGRRAFPFPCQTALKKEFYQNTIDDYMAFMKKAVFLMNVFDLTKDSI